MSTGKHSATSTSNQSDDLEIIKGIGPGFARALNKIGVYHYSDLAQYTPEELAATLLEQVGMKVPAERIEAKDWIGQARELAQPMADELASPESTETVEESKSAEVGSQLTWRQHAGFSLFFDYTMDESGQQIWQTRVYHEESGEETVVPGVKTADWVDLILAQAQLPAVEETVHISPGTLAERTPAEEREAPAEPIWGYNASLEILDVQVEATEPDPGSAENTFTVDVRFQLSGPEATLLAGDGTPFQVETQIIGLEKKDVHFVESKRNQLEPDVFAYSSRQELPVPYTGRYELQSTVTLLSAAEMKARYNGPILNVIP